MSFDINWSLLDSQLADKVVGFLNTAFESSPLPSFLGPISVSSVSFGDVDPNVELVDIRDVYPDYAEEDEREQDDPELFRQHYLAQHFVERGEQRHPLEQSQSDQDTQPQAIPDPSVQLHLRVAYSGNLRIALKTSLMVNYPNPSFMALPLSLAITGLAFDGIFICAFDGPNKKIHVSVQEPEAEENAEDVGNTSEFGRVCDRIFADLALESEVGDSEKHVLKNVGKIEKALLEMARSALAVSLDSMYECLLHETHQSLRRNSFGQLIRPSPIKASNWQLANAFDILAAISKQRKPCYDVHALPQLSRSPKTGKCL